MSFVCFILAADYGIADLLLPARLRALTDGDRYCANERVLVPLSSTIRADVLKRGLPRLNSDCTVDLVAAIVAFARLSKIDWAALDCVE